MQTSVRCPNPTWQSGSEKAAPLGESGGAGRPVSVAVLGGAKTCAPGVDTLGFDACLDYKAEGSPVSPKVAAPDGIDIQFEDVGGAVFDAVLPNLNPKARLPLCALISQDSATALPMGPDRLNLLPGTILRKRMTLRGFIVFDDVRHLCQDFAKQRGEGVTAGTVQDREEMIDGLERAPAAFVGLLRGKAFGKRVVSLPDSNTAV